MERLSAANTRPFGLCPLEIHRFLQALVYQFDPDSVLGMFPFHPMDFLEFVIVADTSEIPWSLSTAYQN